MTRNRYGVFTFAILAAASACGDDTGTTGAGGSGSTVTSTTGAGVTVTSGSGGGGTVYLGQECTQDSNCGPDGKCIKSDDDDSRLGGGPAGGYCTKACTSNTDCPGTDSLCLLDSNDVGECFLGCDYGNPAQMYLDDPLDETKCHGREDLRCQPIGEAQTPVCVPTCGKDSQCGGRQCDPRLAVCVDSPSTGLANGAKCNPDADPPDCAGICVTFTDGQSMCSNWCVVGGELDGNDCGGLAGGICAFKPTANGVGDYGFCTPSCTTQEQCQNPDFWCFNNTFASTGFCFGATDCPGGQGDCGTGETCESTQYGPFCLDFPPAGGTGGGGTGGAGGGGTGGAGGAGGAMAGGGGAGGN